MRKDFAVLFCTFLCLVIILILPQLSASYPMVDESGCRVCHDLGEFAREGLHGTHTECFACHDGPVQLGNVSSSACLACHPRPEGVGETCDIVVYHEGNPNYMPSGATCLSMGCHSDDCSDVPITTTVPPSDCPSKEIYGEGSREVSLLRTFRDNLLSKTPEGQELIKLYYQWSPVIVRTMETDEVFKEELKTMIDELLPLIEQTVE
jgi:hypothetical protein